MAERDECARDLCVGLCPVVCAHVGVGVLCCAVQVPDNGKVGVIGSGKGLTEFKKQKRHEFSVDD